MVASSYSSKSRFLGIKLVLGNYVILYQSQFTHDIQKDDTTCDRLNS